MGNSVTGCWGVDAAIGSGRDVGAGIRGHAAGSSCQPLQHSPALGRRAGRVVHVQLSAVAVEARLALHAKRAGLVVAHPGPALAAGVLPG